MRISADLLKSQAMHYGIKVFYEILPDGLLGVADAETKTITLDLSLLGNPRQHKCVLAEEIGHILMPPRSGHVRYHSRGFYENENCSMIQQIVDQDERKALDWSTSVLMPDVEFNRIMRDGSYTLPEIADIFEVEPWFLKHRIALYRRKEGDAGRKVPKWRELIRRV